jgi:hypothetical protein
MTYLDLVRRYQSYDAATGTFTARRTKKAYAEILGVDPSLITLFYQGRIHESFSIFRGLIRAFPAAEHEAMDAIRQQVVA